MLHLIHFAMIEVEAIVDFAIDLCVAFVGFAMTEVEAILFIATYLCVALDISCNVQHWFYLPRPSLLFCNIRFLGGQVGWGRAVTWREIENTCTSENT